MLKEERGEAIMASKADHTQLPPRNVLIFGRQNGRSAELKRILDRFFNKVYLAADLAEKRNLPPTERLNVIVVTNPGEAPSNREFFSNLRTLYPRAMLICLVDTITRETEKAMRSAGLLFLGSHRQFGERYEGILEAALNSEQSL